MRVKICGINSAQAMASVASTEADAVGFVFFPPSKRAVTIDQAVALANMRPSHLATVALLVDADDALIEDIVHSLRPDWLQLHGQETPARAGEIRARHGTKLMKAIGVSGKEDLGQLDRYRGSVDQFLLDAKAPKDAVLPGGNGLAFDWDLLRGRDISLPWLLAGGLDAGNVAEAIRASHAPGVDVSSGVEVAPGKKSPEKIVSFVDAAVAALDAVAPNA